MYDGERVEASNERRKEVAYLHEAGSVLNAPPAAVKIKAK